MVLVLRDGRLVPPRRGSPLRCRVFDKYRIASYSMEWGSSRIGGGYSDLIRAVHAVQVE